MWHVYSRTRHDYHGESPHIRLSESAVAKIKALVGDE